MVSCKCATCQQEIEISIFGISCHLLTFSVYQFSLPSDPITSRSDAYNAPESVCQIILCDTNMAKWWFGKVCRIFCRIFCRFFISLSLPLFSAIICRIFVLLTFTTFQVVRQVVNAFTRSQVKKTVWYMYNVSQLFLYFQ